MNEISPTPPAPVAPPASSATPPASFPTDPDALLAALLARAGALKASGTKVLDTDSLIADAAQAGLAAFAHKIVAKAIADATGFDAAEIAKKLRPAPAPAQSAAAIPGLTDPDPAPTPDSLAAVLEAIAKVLRRQVVVQDHVVTAGVLWIAGTWGFQDCDIFPRFVITSATKRCGKSTLLAVILKFVRRGLKADNVSEASMFRIIEKYRPTLCVDEADSSFSTHPELRNLVNSGYERSGAVIRCVPTPDGKNYAEVMFRTFAPVLLAGIGGFHDTVLDRAIVAKLERAPARGGAAPKPLRERALAAIAARITPHLAAHAAAIGAAMAGGAGRLPPGLSDRAQDCWEPLIAIADLAGGGWPDKARAAAVALSGGVGTAGMKELLLADLRELVNTERAKGVEAWRAWVTAGRKGVRPQVVRRIRSSSFVAELLQMEHRPWAEFGRDGKGMSVTRLADQLKGFGVGPELARVPAQHHALQRSATEPARVYSVPKLRAVFRQYL